MLAKCHLSFIIYKTICQLDQAKGLDIGTSYLNDKAASAFVQAIADVVRDDVTSKVKDTRYCSFTIDGSTDFTGDDMENIYIRTCSKGKVEDTISAHWMC